MNRRFNTGIAASGKCRLNCNNTDASELSEIRYPRADACLLPRNTGHVTWAAALQFYRAKSSNLYPFVCR